MSEARRLWVTVTILLAIGALFFLLGISWGLPSHRVRPYLYGSEIPWSGETLYFLAGGWDQKSDIGADVDRTPLGQASAEQPVLLNGSNRERAEIIRRYLLYSYQPDEMITFRALAGMGSSWDPKLYQYGGLWIYPVGAMLRIGMTLHLIPAPTGGVPPLVFYLDNPDAFGRFYVAARLYTALWGIAGIWAVWWLARKLTKDDLIAAAAALAYIFLPVVINGAHEAKPHLPGVVLMLAAMVAAVKYLEERRPTREWIWALTAGALCGAAVGMVISSLAIFLMLPIMVWRRQADNLPKKLSMAAAAIGAGILVYALTNPFVVINGLSPSTEGGKALRSNLQNSTDMYRISPRGFRDAVVLLGQGASPLLAMLGVAGAVVLIVLFRQKKHEYQEPKEKKHPAAIGSSRPLPRVDARETDIAWLLLVPAGAITLQFILLAAGKPPEYARFGMLPDIALVLLAAWAGIKLARDNPMFKQLLAALLVVSALPYGIAYSRAFVRDSRSITSRMQASDELPVTGRILVKSEPGPYNTPPVNLFSRDIVLVPNNFHGEMMPGDLLIYPVDIPIPDARDEGTRAGTGTATGAKRLPFLEAPGSLDQFTTPITWANKTFAAEAQGAAGGSGGQGGP
jgi:hypothetical protein